MKKPTIILRSADDEIARLTARVAELEEKFTSLEKCDAKDLTDCDYCLTLDKLMKENAALKEELKTCRKE